MNLINLDSETRQYMLQEVNLDTNAGRLYYSHRLTPKGKTDYEGLLRDAIEYHDETWLAEQLNAENRMAAAEVSTSRRGRSFVKRTPWSDHQTAAFGEFNRFYIRGLCARAIAEGKSHVIVYRALDVAEERAQSQAIVGTEVAPQILLEDLRANIGKATRLGIPAGPNSGISIRLP